MLKTLCRLADCSPEVSEDVTTLDFKSAKRLLEEHTERLLGPMPEGRNVYTMVTMPSGAADNYALVRRLLESGMNCMRINCAHDDPEKWTRMIGNLRRTEAGLQLPPRINQWFYNRPPIRTYYRDNKSLPYLPSIN